MILCTVLSVAISSKAQITQVLNLDSCVQMALRNNHEIKSSQIRIKEQTSTEKSYKANYFPNISAFGTYLNMFNTSSINTDIVNFVPNSLRPGLSQFVSGVVNAIGQVNPQLANQLAMINGDLSLEYKLQNIYCLGVTVKQPVYMGGKITAAHNMSKVGTKMAIVNERLTRDQIVVQTHEAYSMLLKANEMYKVALQYDSLLAQLISDVEAAERHGLRGHNEVLRVQVKKNESELQVSQALHAIQLATMNLCHIIGIPLSSHVQVEGVKSEDTMLSDASASVELRPEYNLLELKNELARHKIKLARSEQLPQLGVQLSSAYVHGGKLMGGTLFDQRGPSTVGIVSLTVPIWHGNEAKHKIRVAKSEYERSLEEQQDLIGKMSLEVRQCANQLDESILELQLANKSVAQAAENLRTSRRAFDVGLETLSDLLEAQTLWQQASAKRAIAESQIIVNRMKYRKACGQL